MKMVYPFYMLVLLAGLSLAGCTTPAHSDTDCNEWIFGTRKIVDKTPMAQRYRKIIELVADGCATIPAGLRDAARQSLARDGHVSNEILMRAAAPYFPDSCFPDDPNIDASQLLKICKAIDYPDGDFSTMLEHIDAVTYFFGKALAVEFKKSGIYKENGKRLIANFFVANAKDRESGKGR